MRYLLLRMKHKLFKRSSESDMEIITTELIAHTKCRLHKIFKRELKKELKREQAIEIEFVEELINRLIEESIAQRNMLLGHIGKKIDTGEFLSKYLSDLNNIDKHTSRTYTKMKIMNAAEESYKRELKLYETVSGKQYIPSAQPIAPDLHSSKKSVKASTQDIWQSILTSAKESFGDRIKLRNASNNRSGGHDENSNQ